MSAPVARVRGCAAAAARAVGVLLSAAVCGLVIGSVVHSLRGNRMAPWILGRAAGITAYALLTLLVLVGLVLSHPARARLQRPSTAARIRLHVALALFTFGATALHIVVLATDRWAGVGWSGALLPFGATYRPAAVTVGLLAAWLVLLAGASAALAGHLPHRIWWPLHKIAAVSFVLVWLHGVFAGSDIAALRAMYAISGALVLALAGSRYVATRPAAARAEPYR